MKESTLERSLIMKNPILTICAAAALALPLVLGGCDREVSHTSTTTVKSDGTVKQKETTVRESADGSVTKEETKKTSTPNTP
jgi:hypothetical protein